MDIQLFPYCLLKKLSSIALLLNLCKKYQFGIFVEVYLWVFYCLSLIHLSIPPVPQCPDYCSYIVILGRVISPFFPSCFLFPKIVFVVVGLMPFHTYFRISLYVSTKILAGILLGIALNQFWGDKFFQPMNVVWLSVNLGLL